MELATALREGKPVVMLVGAADETGAFVPNTKMLGKLLFSVDVAQAAATVEEDRVRILGDVQREFGFDKVNTLAKGAVPVDLARLVGEWREVVEEEDRIVLTHLASMRAVEPLLRAGAALGVRRVLVAMFWKNNL